MSNVYDQTPAPKRLILGTFALASPETVPGRAYELEVLAANATFGDPEPIEQEIRTLLLDGSRVEHLRDGNRASYFQVRVKASNPAALGQAEADLRAELYKLNTLKWTPPHALAPVSVFVVVTSGFQWLFDDHRETQLTRVFGVRFVCLPHVRSDFEVVVPALATPPAGSPTITSIDTCASTTGWTGSATVTTDGSSITVKPADAANAQTWPPVTRWAQVVKAAFNPTPYVRVTARATKGTITSLKVEADSVVLKQVLVDGNDYYYAVTDTSVTTLKITAAISGYNTRVVTPQGLVVDDISSYNKLPTFGTGRQLARTIDVVGSERTPGSVELTNGASLGGLVIVYTTPDPSGYTPPLSPGYLSGTSVTAASNISGKKFSGACVFEKPLAQIPTGRYELAARIQSGATGNITVTWSAQVYVGGVAVGEVINGSASWTSAVIGDDTYLRLGRMLLPVTAVPEGSTATLRVTITAAAPHSLDEAWLFNLTDGALTVVKSSKWCLFLDGATVTDLAPAIWVGNQTDRSDAYALSRKTDVLALGQHIWNTGRTKIFTVTQNAADVPVALRYTPAWSHHPAILEAPA